MISCIRSFVTKADSSATCTSNLMAPDELKNLGFADDEKVEAIPGHAGGATKRSVRDDGKKIS